MFGIVFFFFFKQKTAYEMRISDWSSDVCSSDLDGEKHRTEDRVDDEADIAQLAQKADLELLLALGLGFIARVGKLGIDCRGDTPGLQRILDAYGKHPEIGRAHV